MKECPECGAFFTPGEIYSKHSKTCKSNRKILEDYEKKKKPKKPDKSQYAPTQFFPAKNVALIFTQNDIHLEACNVYEDGTLSYEIPETLKNTVALKDVFGDKHKHIVTIHRPPHVFEIPFRATMPTWLGRRLTPEYMRFLAYSVNPRHGVTFDPSVDSDELDAELLEKFRALLKLKATITKVDWKASLTKGMEDKKGWTDYVWPALFIVQTIIYLAFFIIIPEWIG